MQKTKLSLLFSEIIVVYIYHRIRATFLFVFDNSSRTLQESGSSVKSETPKLKSGRSAAVVHPLPLLKRLLKQTDPQFQMLRASCRSRATQRS